MSDAARRPRLGSASIAAVVSTVASAIFLFAAFRLTVEASSSSVVGCWALIQGLLLVGRIADTGAGANVTRHVSHSLMSEKRTDLATLLLAIGLISFLPTVILSIGTSIPVYLYVDHRFGSVLGTHNILILVCSAVFFAILSSLGAFLLAFIEGMQLLIHRNVVSATSFVLGLVSVPIWLNLFPILGIGFAYITQAGIQLVLSLLVFGAHAPRVHERDASQTVRDVLGVLWSENARLSVIALVQLGFEPITKLLLSTVANLPEIASFELALRVATQIRVLFQAGLQPLLAFGARLGGAISSDAMASFEAAKRIMDRVPTYLASAQLAGMPIVGLVGLGHPSRTFELFSIILIFSNLINERGLLGFFAVLSGGNLRLLLRIQVEMAVVSVSLGAVGASVGKPIIVILAYALAFVWGGTRCQGIGARLGVALSPIASDLLPIASLLLGMLVPVVTLGGIVGVGLPMVLSSIACLVAVFATLAYDFFQRRSRSRKAIT